MIVGREDAHNGGGVRVPFELRIGEPDIAGKCRLAEVGLAGAAAQEAGLAEVEAEEVALAHERADEAQRLLRCLPPAYRRVVVLKYWGEQSLTEIATHTGESVANVKVILHRARLMMARGARRDDSPAMQAVQGEKAHAR